MDFTCNGTNEGDVPGLICKEYVIQETKTLGMWWIIKSEDGVGGTHLMHSLDESVQIEGDASMNKSVGLAAQEARHMG
eukprot:1153933-Pelagomonas_calceolata.AAC.5